MDINVDSAKQLDSTHTINKRLYFLWLLVSCSLSSGSNPTQVSSDFQSLGEQKEVTVLLSLNHPRHYCGGFLAMLEITISIISTNSRFKRATDIKSVIGYLPSKFGFESC